MYAAHVGVYVSVSLCLCVPNSGLWAAVHVPQHCCLSRSRCAARHTVLLGKLRVLQSTQHDQEHPLQKLHPAILELGLAYSDGAIVGSSDRSIAMMLAMHCVVRDFKASESQAFSRALTSYINACVGFLWDECRAACVPQRNSIKWLKSTINNVRFLDDILAALAACFPTSLHSGIPWCALTVEAHVEGVPGRRG